MTPAEAAEAVKVQVQTDKERIEQQVIARYPRASNALRNAALSVLNFYAVYIGQRVRIGVLRRHTQ